MNFELLKLVEAGGVALEAVRAVEVMVRGTGCDAGPGAVDLVPRIEALAAFVSARTPTLPALLVTGQTTTTGRVCIETEQRIKTV